MSDQPAPSNTERTQQALRRSLNALRLEVPAEVAIDVSEHVRQHVAALEAELAAARAEAERLREALEQIAEWTWTLGYERHALADVQDIAHAALGEAAPEGKTS